uniref:Scm polycomb group protein like 4 n=1 Tax=Oryzias latipes TaxID=8090 RepID=A0A3B3HXR4_ORYLA
MTPLAISPPSSTPEPDMSSIPQDAATVPHSATPQVLTVCIYINKQANMGPNLDRKKIQHLPDHFGPDRPSVVLQQAVQGCIDSAFQQKTVFTLLTQGYGGEKISATFDGKQHLLSLPVVNSIDYVLRFLKKLCRSLHCENLFSDQPFAQRSGPPCRCLQETRESNLSFGGTPLPARRHLMVWIFPFSSGDRWKRAAATEE